MSLLARVVLGLSLVIQVVVTFVYFTARGRDVGTGSGFSALAHLGVIAVLVAIWFRSRSGRRSNRELVLLDFGCVAVPCALGLIHRDVKPANVFLCERGGVPLVAKVLDFGLVKRIDSRPASPALSAANTVVGTPLYLAPESITQPDSVDGRADVYAVGAVGYFLLTGVPVFRGSSSVEVCAQHLHQAPVPPSERAGREVPADLEAIVLGCLEKDPARRPQTAAELGARLAATDAKRGWSPEAARAVWARCRELRQSGTTVPGGATQLAIELHHRA